MKKKTLIISLIVLSLCLPLFIKVYLTNKTYVSPEENWCDVGEGFEYEGMRYVLKDVEVFDAEQLADRLGIPKDNMAQVGTLAREKVKYFLMTTELTALKEDYVFDLSQMGMYTKYESGYTAEYNIVLNINDSRVEKGLEVGESTEYYMVFKTSTLYYTEKGLAELDDNDIAMVMFDIENGRMNYLCKGGKLGMAD